MHERHDCMIACSALLLSESPVPQLSDHDNCMVLTETDETRENGRQKRSQNMAQNREICFRATNTMMLDEPLVTGARFGARSLQPCHTCTTARLMSAIEGARPNQQRQKPSRAYLSCMHKRALIHRDVLSL